MLKPRILTDCRQQMHDLLMQARRRGEPASAADAIESLVTNAMDRIAALDHADRTVLVQQLTRQESEFLTSVARDEAVFAVRKQLPERLYYGLLALALEGLKEDWRGTLTRLAMLYRSAEILGVRLEDYWLGRVRQYTTSEKVARFFDDYFACGEKDISAMGYEEVMTKNGFTYAQIRESW